MTAETALRLARYFDTSRAFWLNLQSRFDLELAKAERGEPIAAKATSDAELGVNQESRQERAKRIDREIAADVAENAGTDAQVYADWECTLANGLDETE